MRRALAALALATMTPLAMTVLATPVAVAAPDTNPAESPSGTYGMDTSHTSVHWSISHLGLSIYTARFDRVNGTLEWNAAAPERSTLTADIDAASVSTGLPSFDDKLEGTDYFSAAAHPRITFVSTAIERTGPTTGRVTGNLTMRGVTRPVVMDVTFNGGMFNMFARTHAIGFSATTTINRSDWGLTANLPVIGEQVTIRIETEFLRR
jgi:polyisoprenoid-binding protein YceI